MKITMFLLAGLLSCSIWAKQSTLAVITSDTDEETTVFYLLTTPQGDIDALRSTRFAPAGQTLEDETFLYEEVVHNGALLQEKDGHEVVKLHLDKFSRERGGMIRISYLVNGLRGTRRELLLSLHKQNGQFHLFDLQGRQVNRMLVKGNYVRLLGLVGVSEILLSYQSP
jgi:hypothetical protein